MKLSAPIYNLKHKAKCLSRDKQIPLSSALDHIAQMEGLGSWSLLASKHKTLTAADHLANAIEPGQLIILASRPMQGKTYLGLELALRQAQAGRNAYFFTLEYHPRQVEEKCNDMGLRLDEVPKFVLDTSDDICADYICASLEVDTHPALCVVDYLQLLDQKRSTPPLDVQLSRLRQFTEKTGCCILFLSQIDRQFELADRELPLKSDLRLPNPLELDVFDKIYCLHKGGIRLMKD